MTRRQQERARSMTRVQLLRMRELYRQAVRATWTHDGYPWWLKVKLILHGTVSLAYAEGLAFLDRVLALS